jgi:8-oxo-dGTP pyrophosphatase MutT (NUDIX family)
VTGPIGATILVWRRAGDGIEVVVLHRAAHRPDFHGDWAWTPPAGVREPHETIEECAQRELREETGLELPLRRTTCGTAEWVVFSAELTDEEIVLDAEHDCYEWLAPDEAASRCLPALVGASIRRFADERDE